MARLRSLGVNVAASGGRLRVTAERGELTEQLKEAIAQKKSELLDLLTDEGGWLSKDLLPIRRDGALPLSSFQMRLWLLHRLEPDSTAYNMVTAWPHAEEADPAAIESLIRAVLQENEVLRATFRDDGTAPGIYPLPPEAVRIGVLDLRGRSEPDQAAAMRADRMVETRTPFDLASEAPTRWTLYRVADTRWIVMIAAHHIAVDEWSLTLLRRRIESPRARSLSTLQYADYAAWQRRTQDPTAIHHQLGWWERQLAGISQLCSFPAGPTSDIGECETGSTRPFCWDVELVAELRKLIRREGVTIYMALLAVCAAVLRAHTGQGDIVLGSPVGTRERAEFETMLGPFVNLLVLRLGLDDDPSFIELLARARDVFLDAYDHRQVPFEVLVDRLAPPRSFDRPPLCQVAVVLHNAFDENAPLIYGGGSVFDLTWYAREIEGRIEGSLEYRADLYDGATIDRIISHLETFLRAAVREPTRKLSQISLLTAAERQALLTIFNGVTRDIDRASVATQFERQAAARPDRTAVVFDGDRLSYAELNRRANQLARLLHGRGVGGGALVGVALERSLDMVVALLGVQKAGAAYVPVDPRFPADRLQFMLADSGVAALIATEDTAARFDLPASLAVIDLAAAALDGLEAADLANNAVPEDIAYVIYTSGSTGRPNGVAVSHGALANLLGAMRCRPGLTDTDVVAAVTTISFDIAALELYLPLIVGARIELVSRDVAADGPALARLLSESGATMMQATPATWRLLIEAGWRAGDRFRAFCGGESMPRDLANILLENVHELWNLYGPTETTIWSTAGRVERGAGAISIGQPIANTTVYVLDAAGTPAAIGIPGEIWIGGDGVAAGYHRRPELTAARFVSDPFRGKIGARMYRTGDLGRWGADGRLYHLGRLDRQVKFRGFRIELGEIEVALHKHPAVAQAVVVAQNLTGEQPRLIAYIVYRPAKDLTATEARQHIRRSLPEYMLPSGFVTLDALPLTPNGKIDVRALPDPFKNAAGTGGGHEPPAPGLEQLVAEVWQELLQVDRVGADDNFFELGGNSLLSLRAVTKIEARTGCRLQPRILFFQNLRHIAAAARLAEVTLKRHG
jgi:amino acid adenylation domain-containing protein